ncbi:hypothetical protein KIL84_018895, partial [Mauremys mutica]
MTKPNYCQIISTEGAFIYLLPLTVLFGSLLRLVVAEFGPIPFSERRATESGILT